MQMNILHVEDDRHFAKLFRVFLGEQAARLGMEIGIIHTETRSAAAIHSNTADVIVLDLALPDSNAIETLEWLSRTSLALPPVVIATGLADFSRERWRCFESGAEDFMDKYLVTTDPSQFLERLLHAVARRKHIIKAQLAA